MASYLSLVMIWHFLSAINHFAQPDLRSLTVAGTISGQFVDVPRRRPVCTKRRTMSNPKRTVYVLRSACNPSRYYTGVTSEVNARLAAHNAGRCPHTSDGKPWQIDVLVEFADEQRAIAFEHYLKSGSGSAFAKRHFR